MPDKPTITQQELEQKLVAHQDYLDTRPNGVRLDLTGYDLRNMNLERATLIDAILQDADLSGANLKHALLEGTNLRRASLQNADLRDAFIKSCNLKGADLRGINLAPVHIYDCNLEGARAYTYQRAALASRIADDMVWDVYDGSPPVNIPFGEHINPLSIAPTDGELFWLVVFSQLGMGKYPCHTKMDKGVIRFIYNTLNEPCWIPLVVPVDDPSLYWQKMLPEEKEFYFMNTINGKLGYPEQNDKYYYSEDDD